MNTRNRRKYHGAKRRRRRRLIRNTVRRIRDIMLILFILVLSMTSIHKMILPNNIIIDNSTYIESVTLETNSDPFTPIIKIGNIEPQEIISDDNIEEVTSEIENDSEIVPESSGIPDKYSDIPLDDNLKQYIYDSALESNIPPEILFSLAWKESNYTPNSISETNDYGLFQINKINFQSLANSMGMDYQSFANNIDDPYLNTNCAIKIISDCKNNYRNDNWHQILMRYNMGPSGAEKKLQEGIYSSAYSRKIIDYAETEFNLASTAI